MLRYAYVVSFFYNGDVCVYCAVRDEPLFLVWLI
jgi:hypothetical protein